MSLFPLVCETEFVFHNLFDHQQEKLDAILANGLRPLSDFPDSPRWQQLEQAIPGFYRQLYENIAQPVI